MGKYLHNSSIYMKSRRNAVVLFRNVYLCSKTPKVRIKINTHVKLQLSQAAIREEGSEEGGHGLN